MPSLLTALLEATAARDPAKTAIVWRGARISWGDLGAEVRRRAGDLARAGIGPSDAVALLLPNGPDFVVDFFAVASRGGLAIPLDPRLKVGEIHRHLRGSAVAALASVPDAAPIAEELGRLLERPVPLLAREAAWESGAPAGSPPRRQPVAADADVLCGYSSGSTGLPKRVLRTQANLAHEAGNFASSIGLDAGDVILGVVPFFHAHGLGNCVLAAVSAGATLVIEERFEPRPVLERIEEERVTVFPGVPFMFRMLAEAAARRRSDAPSLRLCFSAGAPLPAVTFEAFYAALGHPVRQLYGCTEAGSVTIDLDGDPAKFSGLVGRPMRNVAVEIVNEAGGPCGCGEVGEIVIRSPALARGYADSATPFREGRFPSGDLGSLDEEGRLRITGRRKLFISTASSKVDPLEVESCIAAHPAVHEVVVVGVQARSGDEIVKAVIVPHRQGLEEEAGDAELRRRILRLCRDHLAPFKLPRVVEFRQEIPRSPLGKILRKDLI